MSGHRSLIFIRRCHHGFQHGRTELKEKILDSPDVEHIDTAGHELLPGCPHIEESLLHQRHFPGLRRLIHDHMLARGKKVAEHSALFFPAYEILAGNISVIYKR